MPSAASRVVTDIATFACNEEPAVTSDGGTIIHHGRSTRVPNLINCHYGSVSLTLSPAYINSFTADVSHSQELLISED
jgi:hypothetical protein